MRSGSPSWTGRTRDTRGWRSRTLPGAAAGGFVPNAWLPDGFNDWQHGGTRMGTKFGGYVIQNTLREFAPEIFKVFHGAHLPFPRLPVPEWWTKGVKVARRP